ncbi:hypothetical protein MSP8887_00576 [Marinomonas spartinae]|jgi:hypothetical protein|uniref:Uncharacterized protein n=1 Tax=Marinomonas foliarum TaxID=491950 RepID=A0ABX7IM14_9GAMM|nr:MULTISPECIES: hypothetical protein [Marinomonas]MBU2320546.1 hypothetical protein [Gammaproteobacteria bacterium]QRV23377.1 hypothetical protein JSY38_15170 [Marinomonas foliarum]TYL48418.1 hypothetical protein FXV75_10980 [Marinomonas sp. IMCC 4694]SBS27219.1 hypothetical protein MSP8887_00576 [Marinomonas spartinae]|tara:strand:- start:27082 stop:27321 length:240 start_codon:yes stop_codon:yes gene_type:complete
MSTYLTAQELGNRIKYHPKYINDVLRDNVFIEGKHYIRPFNARKVLYLWEAIEEQMMTSARENEVDDLIPMASGGVYRG